MRFVRILVRVLVVVAVLVGLLAAYVAFASSKKLKAVHPVAEEAELTVPVGDTAAIDRGRHLATAVSVCVLCHADDLGGLIAADMGPVGRMVGTNLTRGNGGVGTRYTARDMERAIRHGVRPDGTSLLMMPSEAFVFLSDSDMAALLAFLQSLDPVDRALPASSLKPLGRALHAFGKMDLKIADKVHGAHSAWVEPAATAEYGGYLSKIAGCTTCHGPDFAGTQLVGEPGAPLPPDITPAALGSWSEEDFVKVMRTGVRPDGRELHKFMPWQIFKRMTDDELHALWLVLRSAPPRAAAAAG